MIKLIYLEPPKFVTAKWCERLLTEFINISIAKDDLKCKFIIFLSNLYGLEQQYFSRQEFEIKLAHLQLKNKINYIPIQSKGDLNLFRLLYEEIKITAIFEILKDETNV